MPVVISACSSLRLNDFPGRLSIRVTIRVHANCANCI